MNKVILKGRLTATPELKRTATDICVTDFSIEVNRRFNKEQTDFINCQAWRQTAEFITKYFTKGQEFLVEDLCPPLCHELWNSIYPLVYALQNGALLDYGQTRAKMFDARCPDGGRVRIHGEVVED